MLFALTLTICLGLYGLSATVQLFAPFFKYFEKEKSNWKTSLSFASVYGFAILTLWISLIASDIPPALVNDLMGVTSIMTIINGFLAHGYYQAAKEQKAIEIISQTETDKAKNNTVYIGEDGELIFEEDDEQKNFVDYH